MKKWFENMKYKKLFNRGLSLLLSALMLGTSTSAYHILKELGEDGFFIAYAAETIEIDTISELVAYSRDYTATNAKDTLNIHISSTNIEGKSQYQTTATQYDYDKYISIGSDAISAFEGTINISIESVSYFNFSKPLFGYIKDSASINVTGGESDGYLELRRPSQVIMDGDSDPSDVGLLPVFADYVIHDYNFVPEDESNYREWKLRLNYFSEELQAPGFPNFPCVIGSIGSDCKLKLDIKNDTKSSDNQENIMATASGANAGLICGILGADAEVIVSVSGTNTDYSITSVNGHAGALIGVMHSGSVLKLSGENIGDGTDRTITASNGYAGGLVGCAEDAEIKFDSNYTVSESVNGKLGAGGIAGYYKSLTKTAFDLNSASIDCYLTSASAGGLFGILETSRDFILNVTGSTYNVESTVQGQVTTGYYGGLVGTYKTSALTNELTIGDIEVTTNGSSGNCAGLIGKLDDTNPCYVYINGTVVHNTIGSGFYGAVNNAGNAGHFLDIADFTLTGSDYTGAGLVGTIGTGVIRLSGTTDLSSAKGSEAQLVKTRGNALIFADGSGSDSGWTFKRSSAVAADDIGNWGEVLRLTEDILTVNDSAHTVTVAAASTTIANVKDFVRTALNMQLNHGNRGALKFADSTNISSVLLEADLSVTADIDLSGTGIMSLMRDDGIQNAGHSTTETAAAFSGSINGNGNTVSLAIGEYYGMRGLNTITTNGNGNGTLHGHNYGGLIAVANGASIEDLTIGGNIYTVSNKSGMCLGGFIGLSKGDLTLNGIDSTMTFAARSADTNAKNFGGLIGKAEGDGKNVSISGSNHSIVETNANSSIYASNTIGYVGDNTITISFSDYTLGDANGNMPQASLSNPANSTQENASCGGLIGYINGTSNKKIVNIDDTNISKYELILKSSNNTGGLLGYAWNKTEVNFGKAGNAGLVVSDCEANQSTASSGGLVHTASGYWAVNKLKIGDTDFSLNGVTNFGVLVNNGTQLYMELRTDYGSGEDFDLTDNVTITGASLTVYDELVAYSSASDVINEGNGVVSVHTPNGTVVGGKYENQISVSDTSLYNNQHTRYYYDLDVITAAVKSGIYPTGSTAAEQNAYKLMMWSVHKYAASGIQSYFSSSNTNSLAISGDYDLSKVSYYPVNMSSNISIGAASFTFNNENIETSAVAGGTYRSTMSSGSQHYLMHSGLFYNVKGNVTLSDTLTLKGSIGRHENGSGAVIAGTLGNLTEGITQFSNSNGKLLTLDGLTVNAADSVTSGDAVTMTYKPVLINRIGNHVVLNLNSVITKADSYESNSGVKMAGSSLIGIVGTKDSEGRATSDSINLTFNDIRLDARKSTSPDLGSAYGTSQGVFTKATLLDEFIFNNNSDCKGVYNYRFSEDWNSDKTALHHVTYGYEIDGTTEFSGLQDHYVDMLGKTDYSSYDNTQNDNVQCSFSNFLPYVAVRDYDENDWTKRSREIMVNHMNVSLTHGCGTYNDPYIIDANGQIEAIAKILELGDVSDGFTINVPNCTNANTADYNSWCSDDHIQLTYNNGSYIASNTIYNHSKQQLAKYLAGAYYKITKTKNADNTYESIAVNGAAFNGLGGNEDAYAFRGVIVGDDDTATYPLINNTGSPLIKTSYGSVVKDLNINIRNSNITRIQDGNTQKFILASGGCANYGAVIGQILGGDNIIDGVTVDFTGSTINIGGTSAKIIPVGGYVGVVVSGALIFKGTNSSGLSDSVVKNSGSYIAMSDIDWLYVNPIIGRVLNGYAVYESAGDVNTDSYKYSENDVTMKNGTKNYSIADIDPDLAKLEVSAYSQIGSSGVYTTNVTIPNAQSMYILSLLMQGRTIGNDKYGSELKVLKSDSYSVKNSSGSYLDLSYKMMRHAKYDKVGTNDRSDYDAFASKDTYSIAAVSGIKYAPYLVERFTEPVNSKFYVLSLTNNKTVCNMTLSGSDTDWYLPYGFKGIGYIGYGDNTSDGISLHKFDGAGKNIHLNMSLKHYSTSMDNYCPSSGNVGFGLFSSIRHNAQNQGAVSAADLQTDAYKIKNLNLTGLIDYDVVDISEYSTDNVDNTSYIDVGGFAGYCGFGVANDLRIEDIDLSGLTVNGFKTGGGLFGYLNMAKSNVYLAKISDIKAENGTLAVTSKQYAGGIVGRAEQIALNIENMTIDNLSVLTDNDGKNYDNGVGGVIGRIKNNDSNTTYGPVILDHITIGDENASENLRFGYRVDAPLHDTNSNTYYRIATGGLIGHSLMNNNKNKSEYGLTVSNCYVYNVDLFGHRVGGILGHDSNGESSQSYSNIKFSNVHVISTNDATITGVTYNNNSGLNPNNNTNRGNVQNRGCGGIAGYIKNTDYKVLFEDCSVEGYTLQSYNDTGGLCSNVSEKGSIILQNIVLKDLTISSCYHGTLFGYLNKPVNGYNILIDDIQFGKFYNNNYIQTKYGYLVGNNANVVKLVGLSRQGTLDADHKDRICGAKDNSSSKLTNYGTNGYIIWADTLGNCLETATAGTRQSPLTDSIAVPAKAPWVTVSPSIKISGTGAAEEQVLTGDSIMANFAAADALAVSTLDDVKNSGTNSNRDAQANYTGFRNGTNGKTKLLSTYETEMGEGSLPEGVSDFPVIVIDNNGADINGAFNSYVQLLTHQTYNYAREDKAPYRIKIYRCTYNESTKTFERTNGSSGLTLSNDRTNGFIPNISNPDTSADTACFTLIDLQFLDPSNTSEVAYHVYVPVLIKKLMKFSFKVSSLPGTVYDYTNYIYKTIDGVTKDGWGTPSVTNLGTPVTIYFRYDYESTVEEWQAMVDAGESLMWHANKKLLMITASQNLPTSTRMVLVDANNSDRAYFAKASDTGVFTKNNNSAQQDYYIDLTKFKNGNGDSAEYFTSVNFGEKLAITASTTSNGKQAYVLSESGESVYALAKIGGTGDKAGFRIATAADSAKTKYYLTVDGTSNEPPAGLSESYYLTFFTDSGTDPLRVILAGSAPALASSPQNSEVISHTLRCVSQKESALILGNIYKQQFTQFRTENAKDGLVNNGCDYIETDIRLDISINNDAGEADTIIRYLSNDAINVYHSILLTLTKNDGTKIENTIYGNPTYTVNTQKEPTGVYGTIRSKLSGSTVSAEDFNIDEPTNTSSFIQIQDEGFDIKPLLVETQKITSVDEESGQAVTSTVYGGAIISINGLRTHFEYLNITNQFPYQPKTAEGQNVGTTVTAISVLDSDRSNIAYSNIRETKSDESAIKYHSEQPSSASLVYVVDNSNEEELVETYNMLGINPVDEPEYRTNIIIADGSYNATSFIDSALAGKIRWTLQLEKKNESGLYEQVNMSEYVTGNVAVGNRTEGAVFTRLGNIYIYDEDFTTPLDITKLTTVYAMKTGTALEAIMNSGQEPVAGVYANYKVTLSATLYTGSEALTGDLTDRVIDNSIVSDYIKYTNAKVLSGWVNP